MVNYLGYYVYDKFLILFSTPALACIKFETVFFLMFDDITPLSLLFR